LSTQKKVLLSIYGDELDKISQ